MLTGPRRVSHLAADAGFFSGVGGRASHFHRDEPNSGRPAADGGATGSCDNSTSAQRSGTDFSPTDAPGDIRGRLCRTHGL